MKTGTLLAVVASVLFAAANVRATAQGTQAQPAPAVPAGRADVGKSLYMKTGCFQCHGAEGQGGAAGPRLGPAAITLARLSYVRKPTGEMPPYTAKVLSERDLADIFAFLQSLPKPPALTSIPLLAP